MNNCVTPLLFNLNSVRDSNEIVRLWQMQHGLFNCVQSKMIALDDVDLTCSLDGELCRLCRLNWRVAAFLPHL